MSSFWIKDETIAELRPLLGEVEKEREVGTRLKERIAALEAEVEQGKAAATDREAEFEGALRAKEAVHEARCDELRAEFTADLAAVRAEVDARDELVKQVEEDLKVGVDRDFFLFPSFFLPYFIADLAVST